MNGQTMLLNYNPQTPFILGDGQSVHKHIKLSNQMALPISGPQEPTSVKYSAHREYRNKQHHGVV